MEIIGEKKNKSGFKPFRTGVLGIPVFKEIDRSTIVTSSKFKDNPSANRIFTGEIRVVEIGPQVKEVKVGDLCLVSGKILELTFRGEDYVYVDELGLYGTLEETGIISL